MEIALIGYQAWDDGILTALNAVICFPAQIGMFLPTQRVCKMLVG